MCRKLTAHLQALSCLLLLLACGCNNSKTSPVAGVVLLDGQPLANATVQFVPVESGRDATATTNARGEFTMSTFDPNDGAAPGTYKVVISPPVGQVDTTQYQSAADAMTAAAQPRPAAKSNFPQNYTNVAETPLTEVVPVKDGKVRYEVSSK